MHHMIIASLLEQYPEDYLRDGRGSSLKPQGCQIVCTVPMSIAEARKQGASKFITEIPSALCLTLCLKWR